jgi:hypothetical protein
MLTSSHWFIPAVYPQRAYTFAGYMAQHPWQILHRPLGHSFTNPGVRVSFRGSFPCFLYGLFFLSPILWTFCTCYIKVRLAVFNFTSSEFVGTRWKVPIPLYCIGYTQFNVFHLCAPQDCYMFTNVPGLHGSEASYRNTRCQIKVVRQDVGIYGSSGWYSKDDRDHLYLCYSCLSIMSLRSH